MTESPLVKRLMWSGLLAGTGALASIAANTPYEGMRLPGVVTATLLRGRITARDGKIG